MTIEISTPLSILSGLVAAGVPIRDVAMFAGIPAAPQKLQSDAVARVQAVIDSIPTENSGHRLSPESLEKLKLWVFAVERAVPLGPEYARWVSQHVLDMDGNSDEVTSQLFDIVSWVGASLRSQAPPHFFNVTSCKCQGQPDTDPYPYDKFISLPFDPDMTVKTVIELSNAWHEAVAEKMEADFHFPAPWLPPHVTGSYSVIPINSCADLCREGHSVRYWGMENHMDYMSWGPVAFYSVRKYDNRIATIELSRKDDTVKLSHVMGFLDVETNAEVLAVIEPWLRERRGLRFPTVDRRFAWHPDDEVPY